MSNASLIVTNPSTGKEICQLVTDDKADALKKLSVAHKLFQSPAEWLALPERIQLLEKLSLALESKQNEFTETISKEGGKPWQDAAVEVTRAIAGIKIAIQFVSNHRGTAIPLGHKASSFKRMATTQVFPRGVVLAISAFNHPLNLIIHQVIPAFASGCPCIVKPAQDTPLSCKKLIETMHEIGIPKAYVNYVITNNVEVSSALACSKEIAFLSFIGSARVGWMLRSKLQPGVRCALEHGGIAPSIVTQFANLEVALPAIAKGGFYHAGQVCVSTQRLYVDNRIMPEFVEQLCEQVKMMKVGDASDPSTEIGPLIRQTEVERVQAWVTEAIEAGADCVLGGKPLDKNFYNPTILVNPPEDAKVSCQEIFGPVVCIYGYDDLEEALQMANNEFFAFQASIYSENLKEVQRAFEVIEASALMVNDHTAFRDDGMPFAGLKESGLGVGGIPYTIEDMQYEKMLVLRDY